jgi:hypothetical protein
MFYNFNLMKNRYRLLAGNLKLANGKKIKQGDTFLEDPDNIAKSFLRELELIGKSTVREEPESEEPESEEPETESTPKQEKPVVKNPVKKTTLKRKPKKK